jgi:hypothetical protein
MVDKELLVNETRKGHHYAHRTRGLDMYEYRVTIFAGDLQSRCTHVSRGSSRIQGCWRVLRLGTGRRPHACDLTTRELCRPGRETRRSSQTGGLGPRSRETVPQLSTSQKHVNRLDIELVHARTEEAYLLVVAT